MISDTIDIPEEVARLANRHLITARLKSFAEEELRTLRSAVLEFTGSSFKGANDQLIIDASEVAPSDVVDPKLLKARFPDIYRQVRRRKAGYVRLKIEPVAGIH